MVTALRSAARKRDLAELTPDSSSAEFKKGAHQSSGSNDSSLTSNTTPITPVTPVTLLSPQKKADKKRKSVDEMSRMLDEMIQDKVESGHLVKGRTGSVRVAAPRRHSRRPSSAAAAAAPAMSSMMASLRESDSAMATVSAVL
jgi:centromeric protein E